MKHNLLLTLLAVFMSSNFVMGAITWEELDLKKNGSEELISDDVYSLLMKEGKLYAGTADGIWISASANGGDWEAYGLQGDTVRIMNFDMDELAVVYNRVWSEGDNKFIDSYNPLYKGDGAGNWTLVTALTNSGAFRVWVDKGLAQIENSSNETVYLIPGWTYGISYSNDGGATFSMSRPSSEPFLVVNTFGDEIYANYKKGAKEHILLESTDFGETWAEIHSTDLENPYFNYKREWQGDTYLYFGGRYIEKGKIGDSSTDWNSCPNTGDNAFHMTGKDDGNLYVLSSSKGIFYSDDNLATLQLLDGNISAAYRHLIEDGDYLYVATDKGIRRLDTRGIGTGINNIGSNEWDMIAGDNTIRINFNDSGVNTIQLIDYSGKVLSRAQSTGDFIEIERPASKGFYLVKISQGEKTKTKKIVF